MLAIFVSLGLWANRIECKQRDAKEKRQVHSTPTVPHSSFDTFLMNYCCFTRNCPGKLCSFFKMLSKNGIIIIKDHQNRYCICAYKATRSLTICDQISFGISVEKQNTICFRRVTIAQFLLKTIQFWVSPTMLCTQPHTQWGPSEHQLCGVSYKLPSMPAVSWL